MSNLTIGKIAKASGLSIETIRYYEREGILPEPGRTEAGYRIYPESSIARLRFVRRAKRLGFTLAEIRNLLMLSDGAGDTAQVKALTEQKLALIKQRIEDLSRMRDALEELADRCPGTGCLDACPIINALSADADSLDEEPIV